jgi:hypothetical protein
MKYSLIHPFIVLLGRASEYFALHACADDPERIGDDVAKEAAEAGRHRVQLE